MFKTAILAAMGLATTLDAGEVSGKWVGTIKSSDAVTNPAGRVYLEFQENDNAISGTISYEGESKRIEKAKLIGSQLTFVVHDRPTGTIKFKLTVGGNSLTGEAIAEDKIIRLVMTRQN